MKIESKESKERCVRVTMKDGSSLLQRGSYFVDLAFFLKKIFISYDNIVKVSCQELGTW